MVLQPGEQHATLHATIVNSNNQSSTFSCEILLILSGQAQSSFKSVERVGDDSITIVAAVSLDLPADSVAVGSNVTLLSSGISLCLIVHFVGVVHVSLYEALCGCELHLPHRDRRWLSHLYHQDCHCNCHGQDRSFCAFLEDLVCP